MTGEDSAGALVNNNMQGNHSMYLCTCIILFFLVLVLYVLLLKTYIEKIQLIFDAYFSGKVFQLISSLEIKYIYIYI